MKRMFFYLCLSLVVFTVGCSSSKSYEIVENNNMYDCLANGNFEPATEEDISEFNMSIEALLQEDFSFSNAGLDYWIENTGRDKNILFIFSLPENNYEFNSYNSIRVIPIVLKELGMNEKYSNLKVAICKRDGVIRNSFSFNLND